MHRMISTIPVQLQTIRFWFRTTGTALFIALLFVVASPALHPALAESPAAEHADAHLGSAPVPLNEFIESVKNGRADQVVGVYVSGVFAYPIVQQPAGAAAYVSSLPDTATQFAMASRHDTIGLLAHNYLAGASFVELELGQVVALVYGDGQVRYYEVDKIRIFQALSPTSPYSDFIDLDNPAKLLSATDVFNQIYAEEGRLVFQTCIERDGELSWGRIFVSARPVEQGEVRPAPVFHSLDLQQSD